MAQSKANSFTMVSNYKKKGGSMGGFSSTNKPKHVITAMLEKPMYRQGNRYR